eukprot:m.205742 g.205742  ORF g.205742 m.205742 type:complete len:362 (-) comp25329_c1_seq1:139-1224(-)
MMPMRQLLGADECGGTFENAECESVVYIRAIFAVSGMVGCLFIMGMIFLHRTYYNFGQRLIFSLTLAAFLDAIPYFAGHIGNGQLCSFMGFLMVWFDWAVLAWVCCITHKLGVNILYQRETKLIDLNGCCGRNPVLLLLVRLVGQDAVEREVPYHFICWFCTLIIAVIPIGFDAYGPSGPWCWIQSTHTYSTEFQFGIWYIPLFIIIFVLFVANGYIYTRVRNHNKQFQGTYSPELEAEKGFLLAQVSPLKLYPVVFLVLQIPPLINRVQNAVNPNKEVFTLFILHVICSCIFGACIAGIYALNTDKGVWDQCTRSGIARALRMRKSNKYSAGEFPASPMGPLTSDMDDIDEVEDDSASVL